MHIRKYSIPTACKAEKSKNNMRKIITAIACLLASGAAAFALDIEECYSLVRENYPLIRQYDLTRAMSQYSFENAARSTWIPQLSLTGQVSYQSDVSEYPDEFSNLFGAAGIEMEGLSKDQYKIQLQLNQTIWDGGYAKAQREATKAEEEVSLLSLDRDMDALKSQVNQMYFGILVLEANLQTNLYADTLMTDNLNVAKSGVSNGIYTQSEADNIKVEILSLRQQRQQIERSIKTYKAMLSIMIGRQIGEDEVLEMPDVELIDTEENNRVELKLFDAQIKQIESNKRMLNSSVMPKFAFYAQGWYGKPGLNLFNDMMYGDMSWNASLGLTLQWNIAGFYTRRNDKRKIALSQRSVEVQRDIFNWSISLEKTQIQNEIDRMYEIQATDEEIVRLRKTVREASESKFRNGVITSADLLRDITNENNAIVSRDLHEIELLKNIYDMKVTLNQE